MNAFGYHQDLPPGLPPSAAPSTPATEHLKCGSSEGRDAVSVKYTADFEEIRIQKESPISLVIFVY